MRLIVTSSLILLMVLLMTVPALSQEVCYEDPIFGWVCISAIQSGTVTPFVPTATPTATPAATSTPAPTATPIVIAPIHRSLLPLVCR